MAAYQSLYHSGELKKRVDRGLEMLSSCRLCGRGCEANRLAGEKGKCHTGRLAMVSSYGPHFGEEEPLTGSRGSGAIFFSYCNLKCVYCQNYSISQLGEGKEVTARELAGMMLSLKDQGCHNVNLVSPTHVVPQILESLAIAAGEGLDLSLVYNTGGFDSLENLKLLDGIVDIYMPDMKYSNEKIARRLSSVIGYPQVNRVAVKEMHRQVGDLVLDKKGVAQRGLLVRHLVLPEDMSGSEETLKFLAEEVSTNTYVNIMDQYRPSYKARDIEGLDRGISSREYNYALKLAAQYGLRRLDTRQERGYPHLMGY